MNADGYPTSDSTLPNIEDINLDNNLSETESYFQYKIQLDPNNGLYYTFRANAKLASRDGEGAVLDYDQAIKSNPNDALLYVFRANAKGVIGDNKGALKDFNKAIGIDPNNVAAYAGRGLAEISLGNTKAGCKDIDKAGSMGFAGAAQLKQEHCK